MASTARIARSVLVVLLVTAAAGPAAGGAQKLPKEVKRGYDAMRQGRYDHAVERFEEALEKSPESAEARLGLSWAFLKGRRFYSSVENAVKVLERDPASARAHSLIGMVLMRVGALPDASKYLQKALELDPRDPFALAGLAEIDMFSGRLEEGLKQARLAATRAPREPDFQFLLGQCAARQERFEEAATAYENYLATASHLDSDRRDRIRGLIQLYRRLNGRNLYYVTGPKSVDVPLVATTSRLPTVEVMLNGEGPFRFVVDTGAGFVVVSKEVAKRLGMREVARGGTSRGVSGTGRFDIVYGVIDRLSMAEMSMASVPTYIREVYESEHAPVDGYIGLSVLGQFKAAVDYERRILELRPESEPAAPLGEHDVEVPYRITNGGMLSVRVDIGKQVPLNFIVDTGATSTVVSQKAFERFNLVEKQHKGVSVRVTGAGGVTDDVPVVVLDRLAVVGAVTMRDLVRAIVLDLEPVNETAGFEQAGIIGSDVLRFYRVEFEFARGRLIFRPIRSGADLTVGPALGETT